MIQVKSAAEIQQMLKANEISAQVLELAGRSIKVGMTTYELDQIIHEFILSKGAKPSFLGLYGFKGSACISINEELIHGIPSKKKVIKEGDIVFIEKLEAEGEITFDKVIMVGKDDGVKVGAPYVDGASVKATLLKNGKSKKITVFTYKPKKSSKRKMGHRQPYSQVRIEAINA